VRTEHLTQAAWLAAVAILAAGCGLFPSAQPQWVANRTPLPPCGEETLARGDTNVEARQCLLDAYRNGEDAELISTEAITEGRRITRYMRVHADGTIEMFTDATQDSLGSGAWKRETCGQMLGAEEVRDVWIEEVFIILDCTEQPVP
jgi:hypothetical protein